MISFMPPMIVFIGYLKGFVVQETTLPQTNLSKIQKKVEKEILPVIEEFTLQNKNIKKASVMLIANSTEITLSYKGQKIILYFFPDKTWKIINEKCPSYKEKGQYIQVNDFSLDYLEEIFSEF